MVRFALVLWTICLCSAVHVYGSSIATFHNRLTSYDFYRSKGPDLLSKSSGIKADLFLGYRNNHAPGTAASSTLTSGFHPITENRDRKGNTLMIVGGSLLLVGFAVIISALSLFPNYINGPLEGVMLLLGINIGLAGLAIGIAGIVNKVN